MSSKHTYILLYIHDHIPSFYFKTDIQWDLDLERKDEISKLQNL